jgi:Chloramphenicol O-acetyltransferase
MKQINMDNWKRKDHFEFFYRMDYPQYNICMDLDVTHFVSFCKKEKLSFYYSMIYAVTKIANKSENFKYRIREGKVVLHDRIHPSFTDMDENISDDLFKMITVDFTDDLCQFVKAAKIENKNQKTYFDPLKLVGRDDLIYITCIPWIAFTHISHTISLNKNDAVPRISWGKYYQVGNKILLPFSVQVHHALADGIHVGKFVEKLQEYLNEKNGYEERT